MRRSGYSGATRRVTVHWATFEKLERVLGEWAKGEASWINGTVSVDPKEREIRRRWVEKCLYGEAQMREWAQHRLTQATAATVAALPEGRE
jgi:hypothetical protein